MEEARLKNLSALKAEIRIITKEIENFPQGMVTDYYYDYPNGQKRVKPLIGMADCIGLRHRLQATVKRLSEEREKVEQYLDTVEDAEMRVILRAKYVDGMKHEQIGLELGYDRSTIGKKIHQFWQVSHNSPK